MKTAILLFISTPLFGQYLALPATSNYPALATTINGKPNMSSGSGVPTASCTAFLDLYTDSLTNNVYGCPQTNIWQLWVHGTTFTNTEHTISGQQYFPDNNYSNVDVSGFPVDFRNATYLGLVATGWPTVSLAVWSSGTVTLTLSTTAGITSGITRCQLQSVNPSGYNNTSSTPFIPGGVTVIDGTHVSFSLTSNPGTYVSGGILSISNGNRLGVDQGMAINLANNSTATPAISAPNSSQSDQSAYSQFPITSGMFVEGGGTVASPGSCGDCHLIVYNTDTHILWEGFQISTTSPPYVFGSVAFFDLTSNALRTNYTNWVYTGNNNDSTGMTSADVSGLSIADKVLTHAELYAGCPGGVGVCTPVNHPLRITFPQALGSGQGGFTWPASHGGVLGALPIGYRLTLPLSYPTTCANYDEIGLPFSTYPPIQSLIYTLQHYGAIFTDFGFTAQTTADADTGWGNGGPGTDLSNINFWVHCILSQDMQMVREQATQGINSGAIK